MKKTIVLISSLILLLLIVTSCGSYLCDLYDTDDNIYIYRGISYSASSEEEAVEKCKEDYPQSYYRCECSAD